MSVEVQSWVEVIAVGAPVDLDRIERLDGEAVRAELHDAVVMRSRLDVAIAALSGRLARLRAYHADGAPDAATWLQHHAALPKHTARKHIDVGLALGSLPDTTRSWQHGRIGLDHAASLGRAAAAGVFEHEPERELVGQAETMNPEDFAREVDRVIARVRPPGRPRARRERTRLWERDGMTHLHATLELDNGALVRSALGAIADGLWRAEHPTREPERTDPVPHEQRLTDALLALCHDALVRGGSGGGPSPEPTKDGGGERVATEVGADTTESADAPAGADTSEVAIGRIVAPRPGRVPLPTLLAVVDHRVLLEQLSAAGATCELIDGTPLDVATLLRLACECELVPAVLGARGEVLHLGRRRRLVPTPLRTALVLRDRHCVGGRCTKPAAWCRAHHLVPWQHGGSTDLDNLVLVCDHHHDLIHRHGWTLSGSPGRWRWTPPAEPPPSGSPSQASSRPPPPRPRGRGGPSPAGPARAGPP